MSRKRQIHLGPEGPSLLCKNLKKKVLYAIALSLVLTLSFGAVYAKGTQTNADGITVSGIPKDGGTVSSVDKMTVTSEKDVKGNKIHVKVIYNNDKDNPVLNEDKDLAGETDIKNIVKKDGEYDFIITGTYSDDKAFQYESIFTFDTKKPEISISGVKDGSYYKDNLTINIAVNDSAKTNNSVILSRDGKKTDITDQIGKDVAITEEGNYILSVKAEDAAGNTQSETVRFSVDKTAPVIDLKGLKNGNFIKSLSDMEAVSEDKNPDWISMTAKKDGDDQIAKKASGNSVSIKDDDKDTEGTDYKITIQAADKAGNKSEKTMTVTKDTVKPEVKIDGAKDGEFYNKDITVSALAKDKNPDKTTLSIKKDGEDMKVSGTSETVTEEGTYEATAESVDKAGNKTDKTISFTIDKTPPVTSLSGIKAGTHYKRPPEVKAEANEISKVYMKVTCDGKETYSGVSDNESVYDGYKADGDYVVHAYSIDRAGNKGETAEVKFVKDSTAPVISLGGPSEGSYSNSPKDISIKVNERYFKTNKVTVSAYRERKGQKYNIPFSFKNTGEISVNSLSCKETGTYHITVNAEDEAGNRAAQKSLSFTVDTEKPVIEITIPKTENGFRDSVTPSVNIKEDYFESKNITLTKTAGDKSGAPNLPFSDKFDINGGTRTYSDFKKIKENDGVYTLTATARDKAGNSAQATKTFVVDRFGSIFTIKQIPEKKYMKKLSRDIVIEEVNVGNITDYKAEISRDGETFNASNVKAVKKNSYTTEYTIPRSNFKKDGMYRMNLITKDSAGNISESKKAKKGNFSFAIDNTAPVIRYSGIESGEIIKRNSAKLYVSASDTVSDAEVAVNVNGRSLRIRKDENGTYVKVPRGINMDIEMAARDKAGNESTKELSNVTVSTNPLVALMEHKGAIAGIIGVVIAGIVAGAVIRNRRREEEENAEDDLIL